MIDYINLRNFVKDSFSLLRPSLKQFPLKDCARSCKQYKNLIFVNNNYVSESKINKLK